MDQSSSNIYKVCIDQLAKITKDSLEDRIFGCIFGQLIGDALGSYLEFQRSISPEDLKKSLTMPGGGPFQLTPGQVTDDSEMAISMLNGLCKMDKKEFQIEFIAEEYNSWFLSRPFDIGTTTRGALNNNLTTGPYAETQKNSSIDLNSKSLSNGCLMRISPLIIYSALKKLDIDKLTEIVIQDTSLTHSRKTTQLACVMWVYASQQILLGTKLTKIFEVIEQMVNATKDQLIMEWWAMVQKQEYMPFEEKIGHLAIAWIGGFNLIREPKLSFRQTIEYVMQRGGDTDTNGCIIGAMIGASVGYIALQKENPDWVSKILKCVPTHGRETLYKPIFAIQRTFELINKLK